MKYHRDYQTQHRYTIPTHCWLMIASLSQWPAANNFVCPTFPHARFQELAEVWVINLSLLLDCNCWTTYSTSPPTWFWNSAGCWRCTGLFTWELPHPVTVVVSRARLFNVFTYSYMTCQPTTLTGSGQSSSLQPCGQKTKWRIIKIHEKQNY